MTADITFDEATALVVVDVQNDFADPDGGLAVPGGEEVVPVVNELVRRARDTGAGVFYTQDWHPPSTPHFVPDGGDWPVHCVQGTWGAELHPELEVVGPVVQKGVDGGDGYSGFTVRDPQNPSETAPTALERLLRDAGAEQVVVTGLAADVCVTATALDAQRLGFATTVPWGATRAVELEPGDEEQALASLREAGVTVLDA